MDQESGPNYYIKEFIQRYNTEFLIFDKIDVNGSRSHPLFKFLRYNSVLKSDRGSKVNYIPWNFSKFLVGQNG